ncbi:hypothetical protein [Paraburkholderia sp. J63]|uniref:hypothetical protein n=1 Tax=Paraburkholderia sp. J63 TaxID=2805434 RepID=UPI002ABE84E7|nr:hypothetical protein [Paraburkholderia sp. J63]
MRIVIEDGVSGYIVDGLDDAVRAVGRLPALARARCRAEFERRFTAARMTDDYLRAYAALLERRAAAPRAGVPACAPARPAQRNSQAAARSR